ncbi:serine/threonine-protein phosphatase 1 regulatory subunit 10-like isoform X2 [Ruditapes philippinarum]|uniref:serine/threonine-protein phosphatase 1 regulatory subunit 10-like isoform X2 n=1 Tax=Ruditapes philippinarum TaxID=129788 RepID=UPI00295BB339|nr:serine/threonine-protein phosphatase 1 regulatory subunit 10-like isoform X2 [Ruditapes philippinarum]
MAPLDPQSLLKALNELLGPNGAIVGTTEAVRVANLMKDANKLVSKCVYINILKVETPAEILEKLICSGGWDTINEWLQDAKESENFPLLVEILKVYQLLPITVDILKTNNAAKTIKQLCKSDNENTKTLATNIFDEWMKKVKGNNNNSDDKSKKKKDKKDKDRDEKKDKDEKKDSKKSSSSKSDSKTNSEHKSSHHSEHRSSSEHRNSSDSKSKSRDSKHESSHHNHKSDSSKKNRDRDRKIEEENTDSNSNDSVDSDDKVTVRQGSGLKLHIKLGNDKERTTSKSDETDKKRMSTVKRPPSKFRSTGLEEASVLSKLPKNADLTKPIPKRTGSDIKSELPSKRSRPNMPPPLSVPSPSTSSSLSSTSSNSPQSPGEIHGKIKIIPARPKPNHVIHESSGFMNSLDVGRPYGALKKKRRLSGATATPPSKSSNSGVPPTTPPSPISPTSAIAKNLPTVPSFYKDTQEDNAEETKGEEKITNPTNETNDEAEIKAEPSEEKENKPEVEKVEDRSPSPELSSAGKESKGLLTTGATKVKKKKKSVTWKDDNEIKEIFYFEMDEDERVNVNRPKDFNQAQRNEMMADRRAFESSVRMKNDHMQEQITWYRPKIVEGYKVFDYGKDSKEKTIQKLREQSVLQALFFNRNMLPDNPQEPDPEHEEPQEPKIIPVDDPDLMIEMFRRFLHIVVHKRKIEQRMSGGEEFLYNYDSHPQAVQNKAAVPPMEAKIDPLFQPPMNPQQPPAPGPGGFNLPPGLQLPPDLANILSHLQNTQSNPNDPVMSQVQQILNNIMCGGNEQSYEQLQQIQQIMNSQMGLPPDGMMQGPPPGMPMMGMPPGGPPMGPRTLLGNAPPGFMPQRPMGPGPGPNRFGPPGNWGPQGNMGGPPPMGQQGGKFRGGMRGQGQGRGPRGGRGGNFRVLCRHFASGQCRMGNNCTFLHPGINGPPLTEEMLNNQGNS